jgi:SAM-dependent methyltransferase
MVRYFQMADEIVRYLDCGPLLDWGCGYGHMIYLLQNRAPTLDVVGYSISNRAPHWRVLMEAMGREVIYGTDEVRLPFESASFGGVLSMGVLEHVRDIEGSLNEIHRILRPGSLLFIYLFPNKYSYIEAILALWSKSAHPVRYDLGQLSNLLRTCDFVPLIQEHRYMMPWYLKGFPKSVRDWYDRQYGLVTMLDDFWARLPGLNRLSTDLAIICRAVSKPKGKAG